MHNNSRLTKAINCAENGETACFVAGTLVHTKNGLVPIEKIQVGDWVLSQPEHQGERAYKRVTRTFVYEDKEIFLIRVYGAGIGVDEFGVTGIHPFWVKGIGWTRADALECDATVELHDGAEAKVLCASRVYRTREDGIGWAQGLWGVEENDNATGTRVDFSAGLPSVGEEDFVFLIDDEEAKQDRSFRSRVHNLEVEDYHTYYVGKQGVWVHNHNCRYAIRRRCGRSALWCWCQI